jgi:hypothetical protein
MQYRTIKSTEIKDCLKVKKKEDILYKVQVSNNSCPNIRWFTLITRKIMAMIIW